MAATKQPNVRLIDLWKGKIKEYPIERAPAYIAVSHLWSEKLFPIESKNGVRRSRGIKIIKSYLSSSDSRERSCHIWVDTYCIKQNDEADKAQQIRHMGDIYRRARLVLVVMESKIPVSSTSLFEFSAKMDSVYYSEEPLVLQTEDVWQGSSLILSVAELPWFNRIWTAQEYILARRIVWIDSDGGSLVVPPRFLSRLYYCCCVEDLEEFPASKQNWKPWPWETERLRHFDLLDKLQEKSVSPLYSLHISHWRESTYPQDQIYGIMGCTGVNIEAEYSSTLEDIWPRWFERSLEAGHLIWLMSPRTYESHPSSTALGTQRNCVMPEYRYSFQALRNTHLFNLTPFQPKKPIKLRDGSVGLIGRIVGTCVIDTFLGCVAFEREERFEIWAEGIGRAAKGDPGTVTRILKVLNPLNRGNANYAAAGEQICDSLGDMEYRPFDDLELGTAYFEKQRDKFPDAERLWHSRPLPSASALHILGRRSHDRVYLGSVENRGQKSDVLIAVQHDDGGGNLTTHNKFPNIRMVAIDVNGRFSENSLGALSRGLIIASQPLEAGRNCHRNPFHKVGVTYPLDTIEHSDAPKVGTIPNAYVIDAPLERVWIGGKHCTGCSSSVMKASQEVTEACKNLDLRFKAKVDEDLEYNMTRGIHNVAKLPQPAIMNDDFLVSGPRTHNDI